METRFDRIVSLIMAAATLLCAALLIRRELRPERATPSRAGPPELIREWRVATPHAVAYGNPRGPVQLVEFTDFECPFCRRFHESVLPRFLEAFPDSVGWSLVHFPLPMHRFAVAAARAFECAAEDGPPPVTLVNLLYAKQDSFGLKSWTSFGAEAGLRDTASYATCVLGSGSFARIDSGIALANRFGVKGTPGVMVNGWLFSVPPSDSTLIATTRLLLAGGNTLPRVEAPKRR
jgi:protein-disulfide isomerase